MQLTHYVDPRALKMKCYCSLVLEKLNTFNAQIVPLDIQLSVLFPRQAGWIQPLNLPFRFALRFGQ